MDWDGFAATVVRQVRTRHCLSQRALARLVRVPQSTISEIESGKRQPTLPLLGKIVERAGGGVVLTAQDGPLPHSAAATAQEAGQRLAALTDRVDLSRSLREDGALRSVIDLKDSLRRAAPDAFRALVAEPPELIGDSRWDAFIAAVVEDESARTRVPPPAWVHEPERFTKPFWYLSEDPRWHGWELATAPGGFVRHGVLAAADELESV